MTTLRSEDGDAMMTAARKGEIQKVTAFLEDKVPVNSTDQHGNTALMKACDSQSLELVLLLVAVYKADVNQLNDFSCAAIHAACMVGNVEIVEALLNFGADANLASENNYRPLHFSMLYCKQDLLELLLDRGADPTLKDDRGRNSIDVLRERSLTNYSKRAVLKWLYSRCASLQMNDCGQLLLHVSLEQKDYSWEDDIAAIVQGNLRAVGTPDPKTGLYPFQMAALLPNHFSSCFELMREFPYLLEERNENGGPEIVYSHTEKG